MSATQDKPERLLWEGWVARILLESSLNMSSYEKYKEIMTEVAGKHSEEQAGWSH